jgi:3-keto-5-aminohexanoate cleavage enzyme
MDDDKVIVCVAPIGSVTAPWKSPYLPLTPDDFVKETVRCYEAGASIVHIHARDPKTGLTSPDMESYNHLVKRIKEECDIITQIGGGLGPYVDSNGTLKLPSLEQRLKILDIDPKPDMVTVNLGTFDFTAEGVTMTFPNPPDFNKKLIEGAFKRKIGLEFEIYDVSHLYNAYYLSEEIPEIRRNPPHMSYVFGIRGGQPATAKQMIHIVEEGGKLFPNAGWQPVAIGRNCFPLQTLGLILGCDCVRVGMEDVLHVSKGVLAKSNVELVEKIIRIIRELGREVASVDEAREILQLR